MIFIETNIVSSLLQSINTIFSSLISSINNNIYLILDDLILSIKKYENGLYTDKEFMVIIDQSTRRYDNLCSTLEKSTNKDVKNADFKLKERKDEKPNLDIFLLRKVVLMI